MSYIGKNPEVDSVKLKGSATQASGTEEGQLYYNTGTGSISKGLKVFKNSQFVAIDKQLGDADTMQLLKAADIPAVDFSLSLTSTTVGGNNAVPFESSTGDFDGTASFSNSSTGNALLSDESDDLVFHYQTQATNNADNDFFGIPLTVPRAFRGGNLVLEFKYRTLIASGTMDDGYFNIAIQDRSAMISQTQASTISAGAISAGSNVLLTGKTFANPVTGTTLTVAVGDRVYVESGTGTAGSQDNDIVEAYITSVSSTDNNVTLSEDIVAVQSGKFVTGWLTSPDVEGQLKAFASDTNKDGTSKKIQFKTEADTQQISLWFFVKGSSTVKHDLFFDNILLSGNKFLQANSRLKDEAFQAQGANLYSSNNTRIPYYSTEGINESGNLVSIVNNSTDGLSFTALQPCYLAGVSVFRSTGTGEIWGWSLNASSTQMDSNLMTISGANILAINQPTDPNFQSVAFARKLEVGDVVRPHGGNVSGTFQSTSDWTISVNIHGDDNSNIILESQDEIFTDWQDYTPATNGIGTPTIVSARFRRNGPNMQIEADITLGTTTSSELRVHLPSGYVTAANSDTKMWRGMALADPASNTNFYVVSQPNKEYLNFSVQLSGSYNPTVLINGDAAGLSSGEKLIFSAEVPIQGWNTNFNPLLSMPLQDFSSLENTFSARLTNDGSTSTITSQSGNFISSVSRTGSTGGISVTFTPGFFSEIPSIVATCDGATGNRWASVSAISTSGCTINADEDGSSNPNQNMNLTVTRQGGDFRQAPQATAAVIKPAVCEFSMQLSSNSSGGDATGGAWNQLKPNTFKGETWFVSGFNGTTGVGGTNTDFDLDPGTYSLECTSQVYSAGTAMLKLISGTTVFAYGQTQYTNSTTGDAANTSLFTTFTITSKTTFTIKMHTSASQAPNGLGHAAGISGVPETYLAGFIHKLK